MFIQKIELEESELNRLKDMKPMIKFKRDCLIRIKKDEDYDLALGEDDLQIDIQKERESKIMYKIYFQEENIPDMPNMSNTKRCTVAALKEVKNYDLKALYDKEQLKKRQEELKQKINESKRLLINIMKLDPGAHPYTAEQIGQKIGNSKWSIFSNLMI